MKVPWQKERSTGGETAVQLRSGGRSTFGRLESYVPLLDGETALYREVREAVPVVDAAICKLIRLTGGVRVACGNERAEQGLQRFLCEVPVGRGQRGINAFLDCYLDSLLTCGRAVGEIVPDAEGREIAAVLCADVSQVEVREGDNPLEFCLCGVDGGGRSVPLEYQDLLLFTPLNPEAGHPYGVSMLRSMPYLTGLLLKIYDAMGKNWDRCGNVRFAVTYKPQDGELDRGAAQERAEQIAEEWSRAMQEGRNGSVRDFVSVGDVSIKAIGADNQILDSETPVRQILEQLVAKTGLPPFMLGLSWSSTERMSSQQADMLTSEITALRRTLEPVIERVCTLWLRMHGYCDKRYGVIAEALVVDSKAGVKQSVKNEAFCARGGTSRRVFYVPARSGTQAMRYTGEYQIAKSKEGAETLRVTIAGRFTAAPGDIAAVSGTKIGIVGNFRVIECVRRFGESGEACEVTMQRE